VSSFLTAHQHKIAANGCQWSKCTKNVALAVHTNQCVAICAFKLLQELSDCYKRFLYSGSGCPHKLCMLQKLDCSDSSCQWLRSLHFHDGQLWTKSAIIA